MNGLVLWGINNIYTVSADDGRLYECRIKGKVLKGDGPVYNPIAVGDRVEFEPDPRSGLMGMVTSRSERTNGFSRWNRKKNLEQVIAANIGLVVIVTSTASPPWRPRFADRMLVASEICGVEPLLVINKADLTPDDPDVFGERVADFRRIGYRVMMVSATTGQGMEDLRNVLREKTAVFSGQSGVGKSSLLNALEPGLNLRVGDISAKWDRGSHTTTFAVMARIPGRYSIIDTPGVRELYLPRVEPRDLRFMFPEFREPQTACAFQTCTHMDEPDCAVVRAVGAGSIHADRYESYAKIYADLTDMRDSNHE